MGRLNVHTLIEILKEFPSDMPVIIEDLGDGGGYNHARHLNTVKVSAYSGGGGSYYGELTEYEEAKASMTYRKVGDDKEYPMFTAHFEALVITHS